MHYLQMFYLCTNILKYKSCSSKAFRQRIGYLDRRKSTHIEFRSHGKIIQSLHSTKLFYIFLV